MGLILGGYNMSKNKVSNIMNSSENIIVLLDDYSTFDNLIETGLIKNELPYIWLSVKFDPSCPFNLVEQISKVISEKLQLSIKKGQVENTYHFTSKKLELDHKYHCIDLWAAAAMIQHSEPKTNFLIASRSRLANVIKSTPADEIYEENSDAYKGWQTESFGISTTEDILLYLSHAGINLKSTQLSTSEFRQTVSALLNNKSAKSNERRSQVQITKAS